MDQWPRIRRLANGAIDYDFYRGKARAERIAAIAAVFAPKRRSGLAAPLTLVARLRAARKS